MVPFTAWSALLSGCIIYEQVEQKPQGVGDTAGSTEGSQEEWTWQDPSDPTTPSDPTDPQTPQPTPLRLTVHRGLPGDLLLSSLVADGPFDFATIAEVQFSSSVLVSDLQLRGEEAVLALSVDPQAAPGPVGAVVLTLGGEVIPVQPDFTVLAGQQGPDDTGHDTGATAPDTAPTCP